MSFSFVFSYSLGKDVVCGINAKCAVSLTGIGLCFCNPGYTGNPLTECKHFCKYKDPKRSIPEVDLEVGINNPSEILCVV